MDSWGAFLGVNGGAVVFLSEIDTGAFACVHAAVMLSELWACASHQGLP